MQCPKKAQGKNVINWTQDIASLLIENLCTERILVLENEEKGNVLHQHRRADFATWNLDKKKQSKKRNQGEVVNQPISDNVRKANSLGNNYVNVCTYQIYFILSTY